MNIRNRVLHQLVVCMLGFFIANSGIAQQTKWRLMGPGDADQVTAITVLPAGTVWVGTDVGGLYKSVDRGANWVAKNHGLSNLDVTTPIVFSNSAVGVMSVGTRGGLFKSLDEGETWTPVRDGLPKKERYSLSGSIGGLAIDPFDPNRLLLGMGYRPSYEGNTTISRLRWSEYLYHSDDGGQTWKKLPAFPQPTRVNQIVYSSTNKDVVYTATDSGLFGSSDGGRHWKLLWNGKALNVVERADNPRELLIASADAGVYRSNDGGKTWLASNNGLRMQVYGVIHSNRYCCFAQDSRNPASILIANSSWGYGGGLYSSNDFGGSWKLTTEKLPESWLDSSRRFNAVAIQNDERPSSVYAGSSRYLYRSNNNGTTWEQLISTKTDSGWKNTGINVFGQTRQLLVDVDNANTMFIGTADHKLVKSIDAGISWRLLERDNRDASNIWDMGMCPVLPKTLYAVSSGNRATLCLMKSGDHGESWQTSCGGLGSSDRYERILIDSENCARLYVGTRKGIFFSSDAGTSWTKIKTFPKVKVYDLVFGDNSKTIYAATEVGLLRTTNDGENWLNLTAAMKQPITSILVARANPNILLLGTQGRGDAPGGIWRSNNSGKSWQLVQGEIAGYVTGFAHLPANNSVIYTSTMDHNSHDDSKGSGVYRTTDLGLTWLRVDEGLPVFRGYRITSSKLHPNSVFFASAGSGVYVQEYREPADSKAP